MPGGILHEFRNRSDLEYRHDILLVLFRGPRRDVECRSHLLGRAAFGKELKHFSLTKSQGWKIRLVRRTTFGSTASNVPPEAG